MVERNDTNRNFSAKRNVRFAPKAAEVVLCSEWTRRAMSRRERMQQTNARYAASPRRARTPETNFCWQDRDLI